jgi:hypothetical protein
MASLGQDGKQVFLPYNRKFLGLLPTEFSQE